MKNDSDDLNFSKDLELPLVKPNDNQNEVDVLLAPHGFVDNVSLGKMKTNENK